MKFKTIRIALTIVILGSIGFTWANQPSKDKPTALKKESNAAAASSKTLSKSGPSKDTDNKVGESTQLSVPTTNPASGAQAVRAISQTMASVKPLPRGLPDPSITKIQAQINDIIRLNESLRGKYKDQVDEIQRVNDQARSHKRILEEINSRRQKEKPSLKPSDAETILQQEKIRLIRQQTDENKKFIDGLEQGKGREDNQKPASQAVAS